MPARKKQTKHKSFFSKLNPNTKGQKLIAFVLVFAVLGGGYYAYRSFAATGGIGFSPSFLVNGTKQYESTAKGRYEFARKFDGRGSIFLNQNIYSSKPQFYRLCLNLSDTNFQSRKLKVGYQITQKNGDVSIQSATISSPTFKKNTRVNTMVNTGLVLAYPAGNVSLLVNIQPTENNTTTQVRQVFLSSDRSCPDKSYFFR